MDLTIRPAQPADADIIADYNAAIARETEHIELDRERLAQGVHAVLSDPSKGFYTVAEADGRVVGQMLITYEWSDWRNGVFWWIQSVYVHADYRRRGVFQELYRHIAAQAKQAGTVCGLRLYVGEGEPARAGDLPANGHGRSALSRLRSGFRHPAGTTMMETADTAPIRPGEELPLERLAEFLRACLPDWQEPLRIEQFPGGHSNLTYLLRVGERELVLRRPPVGPVAPTAHDMVRECRLLELVHPAFPLAPRPYLCCEGASVIGVPFYVMERRRGVVVRRELPAEFGEDLALRRRVSEAVVDTLADLPRSPFPSRGRRRSGRGPLATASNYPACNRCVPA